MLIARDKEQFKYLYKQRINFVAKRVARFLRKMISVLLPALVYCYGMLNNRQQAMAGGGLYEKAVHS